MKIILLGAPNSGKGTLSAKLAEDYGFIGVSTGELLRKEVASGSELGKKIDKLISAGNLVDSQTVIALMNNFISTLPKNANIMFDGFPRTIEQAQLLQNIAAINAVLFLNVSEQKILERALGRISCKNCGTIYSRAWYSKNTCEKCGGEIVVRSDDTEEAVKKRIEVYKTSTMPLIEYYKKENLLFEIDANGTVDDTLVQAKAILEKLN